MAGISKIPFFFAVEERILQRPVMKKTKEGRNSKKIFIVSSPFKNFYLWGDEIIKVVMRAVRWGSLGSRSRHSKIHQVVEGGVGGQGARMWRGWWVIRMTVLNILHPKK